VRSLAGELRTLGQRADDLALRISMLRAQGASDPVPFTELHQGAARFSRLAAELEHRADILSEPIRVDPICVDPGIEVRAELVTSLVALAGRSDRRPENTLAGHIARLATAQLLSALGDREVAALLAHLGPLIGGRVATMAIRVAPPGSALATRLVSVVPHPGGSTTGRRGIAIAGDHLELLEAAAGTTPDGRLESADLSALVRNDRAAPWMRRLATNLLDRPALLAALTTAPRQHRARPASQQSGLTRESIDRVLAAIDASVVLADHDLFEHIDGAITNGVDGLISQEDIARSLDRSDLAPEVRGVLSRLVATVQSDGSSIFDLLDTATEGPNPRRGRGDGLVSYADVVATAVNLHAFADDPTGARAFVAGLPATFDDLSGRTPGLPIRAHSDEGVLDLAAAALEGPMSFTTQVSLVARLPESGGGVRNRLFTVHYAALAERLERLLNGTIHDHELPVPPGHSGATWPMFGTVASHAVHAGLTGRQTVLGLQPSWHDRQALADGNQYIFGDIAPRLAALTESFGPSRAPRAAEISGFFASNRDPTDPDRPMFRPGHGELRDALLLYLAAAHQAHDLTRQRLTMQANLLLAVHEQAGAQHALEEVIHQQPSTDGLRWAASLAGRLVGIDTAVAATSVIEIRLGTGPDAPVIRPSQGLPTDSPVGPNLIAGDDLLDELDPRPADPIAVGDVLVTRRSGQAHVGLPPLAGWGGPPTTADDDRLTVDPARWFANGAEPARVITRQGPVEIGHTGSTDGSDLAGTEVHDWSDPDDRMWFIANLFRISHTDQVLWSARAALGGRGTQDAGHPHRSLPLSAQRRLRGERTHGEMDRRRHDGA